MITQEPIIGISGHLSIEIVKITLNKSYNCAKYGFTSCKSDLCYEKKHFMVNPTTKQPLCATEVEMIMTNMGSKKSIYFDCEKFQMVDTDGFTYKSGKQICGSLQNGLYQYCDCNIQPNSFIRVIVCFPELKENVAVHKIYYDYYDKDNQNDSQISLQISPLSEKAQRKIYLLNKRKQIEEERLLEETLNWRNQQNKEQSITLLNHLLVMLDRLREDVFHRLNNYLTKSEKINLENQIMNADFNIRKQAVSMSDTYAKEILKRLDDIMSDYRKQLIPANGDKTEVWERISNEGAREDLGETIFRSSWEANIARILNLKDIHWEYETTPFMLETIPYLPDFFLDDGTIMEIKGRWDNESIAKVEAFMRSNPETNYLIVDHDMYPDLTQMYADKIPTWEKTQAQKEKVNVVVVGLSFVPDKSVIKNLQVGETLQMEFEPNNEFDKFAIAVKTSNGGMVGHIEKKFAPIYAQKIKLGMTFSLDITSIEPKIIRAKAYRTNWEKPITHSILFNSEA